MNQSEEPGSYPGSAAVSARQTGYLIGNISHKQADKILRDSIETKPAMRSLTYEDNAALDRSKSTQFTVEAHVTARHALVLKNSGVLKTYVNSPLNVDNRQVNTARAIITAVGKPGPAASSTVKVPRNTALM